MEINSPLFQIAEQRGSAKVAETEKFFFTDGPRSACNIGWHGEGNDFFAVVIRVSGHFVFPFGLDDLSKRSAFNRAIFARVALASISYSRTVLRAGSLLASANGGANTGASMRAAIRARSARLVLVRYKYRSGLER